MNVKSEMAKLPAERLAPTNKKQGQYHPVLCIDVEREHVKGVLKENTCVQLTHVFQW